MVAKMHETTEDRPAEEARLDQAMTSMDPILQASLKREQQRRLRRKLLYGGLAMALVITVLSVVFSNPGSVASEGSNPKELVASAEQLGSEGWRLWQSGSPAVAEDKFKLAVEADPKSPHLWNGLGWSRVHQREYDLAIEAFQRSVKLERKHAGALNGLGQAYLFKREYDLAEPYLRRSEALTKGASAASYALAKLYLLQGDYGKAKATIAKMKKAGIGGMDPDNIQAMADAAENETLSDELRSVIEPAEQTESAEVDDADDKKKSAGARNMEGWKHFQLGNGRAAEIAFRAALKKAPDMQAAQNGLGFALLSQGKPEEATPIFKKLVKAEPKGAGYVNGLARCYAETGDHKKAVSVWKTLENGKGPPNALTWGLARSLIALERFDEALATLKHIKAAGGPAAAGVDELIEKCKGE